MTVKAALLESVRPEVVEIFADVFEYFGDLSPATSPDDVERWDSLQHIALVRALEDRFDLTLSMDEMAEIDTVRSIDAMLRRHGV